VGAQTAGGEQDGGDATVARVVGGALIETAGEELVGLC
jgi:hypothetical protein